MPTVCIQAHSELEVSPTSHRRLVPDMVHDLDAIKPDLKKSPGIFLPVRLDHHLMPHTSRHGSDLRERISMLLAGRAHIFIFHARVHLIANNPDRAARHAILATIRQVREISNELCQIVALRWLELPVLRRTEGEAVEASVAFLVRVILVRLGVVTAGVSRRDVGLRELEHGGVGGIFVVDVAYLRDGALGALVDVVVVPVAGVGAFVLESLDGLRRYCEA